MPINPPALGPLRLARLSDLTRLGVVAAAGFYHSPFFAYERPDYASFPNDTLSSYRSIYREQILDPQFVVIVAEGSLDYDEASACYEELKDIYPPLEDQIPEGSLKNGKAIVGVAGLKLQNGSRYHGMFQPEGPNPKIPADYLGKRDQSPVAAKYFQEAIEHCEARAFVNRQIFDTMVVHPAYFRHGHGTDLALWMISLAATEKVGLGVLAAKMGRFLYKSLGFEEIEKVELSGYDRHPNPINGCLSLYNKSMQD